MSNRKSDRRRNRHRSEQHDRRHLEMIQRRVAQSRTPSPPLPTADPPSATKRANSDPGPPPTPAPLPTLPLPVRTRRALKRQSKADSPTPLYSEQNRYRCLGRSSAKMNRPLTPPQAEAVNKPATPPPADVPEAMPVDDAPADNSQ